MVVWSDACVLADCQRSGCVSQIGSNCRTLASKRWDFNLKSGIWKARPSSFWKVINTAQTKPHLIVTIQYLVDSVLLSITQSVSN